MVEKRVVARLQLRVATVTCTILFFARCFEVRRLLAASLHIRELTVGSSHSWRPDERYRKRQRRLNAKFACVNAEGGAPKWCGSRLTGNVELDRRPWAVSSASQGPEMATLRGNVPDWTVLFRSALGWRSQKIVPQHVC